MHQAVDPVAFDCVKLIVVPAGSAIVISEFGQRPVKPGDATMLNANPLCGGESEGYVTMPTIDLGRDYLVDQVF